MPTVVDFRISTFHHNKVDTNGKYIGRRSYPKLYAIENLFRVIIHSVLSAQVHANWWEVVVDKGIRSKAERFQQNYVKKASHSKPGRHGIYYIDLKDLNEILRVNAAFFDPIIPDLNKWILGIEEIRLPRNIVAHMNFPHQTDMKRIDVFYHDCLNLVAGLQARIELEIP
ncbi:MAG: hypothetical protein AAB354_08770 [candidate division KSB1 bacterium]